MKDIVKKSFLVGLGVTAMAKGKVEAELKKLLKENDITAGEAQKAANQFLKDVEKYKKKAMRAIKKEMLAAEKEIKKKARAYQKTTKKKVVKRRPCKKKS